MESPGSGFAASMTIGRLVGDRLTAAVAPAALLRACGLIGGGLAPGLVGGTPVTATRAHRSPDR